MRRLLFLTLPLLLISCSPEKTSEDNELKIINGEVAKHSQYRSFATIGQVKSENRIIYWRLKRLLGRKPMSWTSRESVSRKVRL